jgi:hypothetical protein
MSLDIWLSEWGLTLGVGSLMLLMVFIVWDLAQRDKAGRTVPLFYSSPSQWAYWAS